MTILKNLENILLTELSVGAEKKSLDPDEDLLQQGIIDSLQLIRLISSMEKTFDIKIIDEDIIPDNFQSLNSMVKLVQQQIGSR